jgi:hypothetical protein
MMEIDQLAALRTTLDFHLLLTQSNPPARISLPPLSSAEGASDGAGISAAAGLAGYILAL